MSLVWTIDKQQIFMFLSRANLGDGASGASTQLLCFFNVTCIRISFCNIQQPPASKVFLIPSVCYLDITWFGTLE